MQQRSIVYPSHSALEPLVRDRRTLVVFLRHFGCTFSREALADVAAARPAIATTGTALAFVYAVSAAEAEPWFERAALTDVPRVSDATLAHYRTFGLETTTIAALVRPGLWVRGAACALQHGFGAQPPTLMRQLPGAFVVHGPHLLAEFRHRSPSDRPDYLKLVQEAAIGAIR